MDCIVHGVAKSRTRLSDFRFLSLKASNIGQILESEQWKITLPSQLSNFPTYLLPKTSPITCSKPFLRTPPGLICACTDLQCCKQWAGSKGERSSVQQGPSG